MVRGEAEVRKALRYVEERLRCPHCGRVMPEPYYDGEVECRSCRRLIAMGSWIEFGMWKALKWVLGELSDEELKEG